MDTRIRILTVLAPYGWALVNRHRDIENLDYPQQYRGGEPVLIQASTRGGRGLRRAAQQVRELLSQLGVLVPSDREFSELRSCIIGQATLGKLHRPDSQPKSLWCRRGSYVVDIVEPSPSPRPYWKDHQAREGLWLMDDQTLSRLELEHVKGTPTP